MTAEIIIFPVDRRVARVRAVVTTALARQPSQRAAYWKRVKANYRRELRGLGLPEPDVRAEIDAFRDAVRAEAARRRGEAAAGGKAR